MDMNKYIVLTEDNSPLGLELQTLSACKEVINWQRKGGFNDNFKIAEHINGLGFVVDNKKVELNNTIFTKEAWSEFCDKYCTQKYMRVIPTEDGFIITGIGACFKMMKEFYHDISLFDAKKDFLRKWANDLTNA